MKSLLRKEDPLLAIKISEDPVALHKLIKHEPLEDVEELRINTVEFSEAQKRVKELLTGKRLSAGSGGRLDFLVSNNAQSVLTQLNVLRNRMWHRGAFVLRYPALDMFIGGYVLPLVQEILTLSEYADMDRFWRYKALVCSIDPVTEIVRACKPGGYKMGKAAILKELGRAAYRNPRLDVSLLTESANDAKKYLEACQSGDPFKVWMDPELSRIASRRTLVGALQPSDARAREIAQREVEHELAPNGEADDARSCPVCGTASLCVYRDRDYDEKDENFSEWVYEIKCTCCSFELRSEVGLPSREHGLPLEDYWSMER